MPVGTPRLFSIETASTADVEQELATERLPALAGMIEALDRSTSETDLIPLIMDGLAFWFDAAVRVYRQESDGTFVLQACRPCGDAERVAARLRGHWISARNGPFCFDVPSDAEAAGWDGQADATFVPLSVDDSTEWLLAVSGGSDPQLGVTLGLLSRIVSIKLTQILNDAADRLRRTIGSVLTFGDAPFDATSRLALEVIARETGALSAQIATFRGPHNPPALVIGWASPEDEAPLFVDASTTHTTKETIRIGVALRSGVTAVLALRAQPTGFSAGSTHLAQAAADMLGSWLSGTMVRRSEVRVPAASEYSQDLVGRLAGSVDRSGRLEIGGALAVVLPQVEEFSGVHLDAVIQVVQERVRSSDVVGIVASGAGVFIPGAGGVTASALIGRLLTAGGGRDRLPLKVGVITFPPLSASPEVLVARALSNARQGMAS
jgi:hypothetical protein